MLSHSLRLDNIDYGRRMAVEKELRADSAAPAPNAVFDDSGNFLLYATLFGIKVCCVFCMLRCTCFVYNVLCIMFCV